MPDRIRQALFNLMRGHTEEQAVVDVFSGVGSFGLEAISRGASSCVFVEMDRSIIQLLEKNIELLGVEDRCTIVRADALGPAAIARCPQPVHLVMIDPPYAMIRNEESCKRVLKQFSRLIELLDETGYGILRTPWPAFTVQENQLDDSTTETVHTPVDLEVEGAIGPETHAYGSMALHLYMRDPGAANR